MDYHEVALCSLSNKAVSKFQVTCISRGPRLTEDRQGGGEHWKVGNPFTRAALSALQTDISE